MNTLLTPLWNWCADVFAPWLKNTLTDIASAFMEEVNWFKALIYSLYGIFSSLLVLMLWALSKMGEAVQTLNIEAMGRPGATMLTYFAFMDRFLPMQEAFAGAVVYFNIWLAITVIRWVKSFIPTLSN